VSAGLAKLVFDDQLAQAARQHSSEMISKAYFSHVSPDTQYTSVSDRVNKSGLTDIEVGENIAYMPKGNVVGYGNLQTEDQIADALHDSWMKSPGHKANIMNTKYNRIGIGVVYDAGNSRYYATQVFANMNISMNSIIVQDISGSEAGLLVDGVCLVSNPEVSIWIGGNSQVIPLKDNNKINFTTKIAKNSGVVSVELGIRPKTGGGWYSIGNKFYLNTNSSADSMLLFSK
jgi:hypothetical protein